MHDSVRGACWAGWAKCTRWWLRPTIFAARWRRPSCSVDGLLAAVPEVVTFSDLLAYPAVEQDVALVVDSSLPASAVVRERAACRRQPA